MPVIIDFGAGDPKIHNGKGAVADEEPAGNCLTKWRGGATSAKSDGCGRDELFHDHD